MIRWKILTTVSGLTCLAATMIAVGTWIPVLAFIAGMFVGSVWTSWKIFRDFERFIRAQDPRRNGM